MSDILMAMADDAFVVLNWARREGMKKDKQLEQVVAAFEKTLKDRGITLSEGDGK